MEEPTPYRTAPDETPGCHCSGKAAAHALGGSGAPASAFPACPDEDELADLAELFKVFGDSTRIRILFALFSKSHCVCELADGLHMTQSAISHQLRILKQARLVRSRRSGQRIVYSLADDHVRVMIDRGLHHIEE